MPDQPIHYLTLAELTDRYRDHSLSPVEVTRHLLERQRPQFLRCVPTLRIHPLGTAIGLMIYAQPYEEALALRIASAYEQATDWHRRRPDLSWIAWGSTDRKEGKLEIGEEGREKEE